MKTIIIEDQKLGIDLVRNCLTDKFELVATCQTIKDGWKAYEKHSPEVVILDIELPDGSGLDLANRILKDNSKVRILGVSGRTDDSVVCQRLTTDAYDAPHDIRRWKHCAPKSDIETAAGNRCPFDTQTISADPRCALKKPTRFVTDVAEPVDFAARTQPLAIGECQRRSR